MSDITMCANRECPLRAKCYRAQAVANPHWQSYGMFDHTKLNDAGEPECLWVKGRNRERQ